MEIKVLLKKCSDLGIQLWIEDGRVKFSAPLGVMTGEMKSELKENKEKIFDYLSKTESNHVKHNETGRYEKFELTKIQASYELGKTGVYEYGGTGCQIYVELRFKEIELSKFQMAWEKVIKRHDMLRAIILPSGYQRVLERVEIPKIPQIFTRNNKEYEEQILKIRNLYSQKMYTSDNWPLYDLCITTYDTENIIHFSMDMLIGDSVSVRIILKELLYFYSGEDNKLDQLEITYKDILEYRQNTLFLPKQLEKNQRDKKFWMERIDTLPEPPDLSNNKNILDAKFEHKVAILGKDTYSSLLSAAAKKNVTISLLLFAAYSEVIGRWSRNKEYCMNITTMNRPNIHPQIYNIVGDFTDVIIMDVRETDGNSFEKRILTLQERLWTLMEHNSFSGVDVIRELRNKNRNSVIVPYIFTSTIGIDNIGTECIDIAYRESRTPQVFIDCQVGCRDGELEICWDIRKSIFNGNTAQELFEAFVNLVCEMAENEDIYHEEFPVKLSHSSKVIRDRVNSTLKKYEPEFLYDGFIKQVLEEPEKIALVDQNGKYTYKQMYEMACGAADNLYEHGFKTGDKVAVIAEKSVFQISAVLGILIAGGIYVPIDLNQPDNRIFEILMNVGAQIAFATDKLSKKISQIGISTITSIKKVDKQPQFLEVQPSEPAYIIFTSGSTGIPKGVVISHRSAMNTIRDVNQRFQIDSSDTVLGVANLAFDLSVFDIFGTFAAGGILVLPDEHKIDNAEYLANLVADNQITVWNSTPAQMEILLAASKAIKKSGNMMLKRIFLSGDWINPKLSEEIMDVYPNAQVYSLGGATEASIWSIFHKIIKEDTKGKSIPYGCPLSNQRFYILDKKMQDSPDWVIGNLYIAGDGLALEYYGDKETTDKKFIYDERLGERLYYTGDIGRYREDGTIEFWGREDTQVKIRGHRIELGEIESAMISCDKVSQAVAVVTDRNDKEKKIYGFVVPEKRKLEDYSLIGERLKQYLTPIADEITKDIDGKTFIEYMGYASKLALSEIILFFQSKGIFTVINKKHELKDILYKIEARPEYHKLVKRWLNELVREKYVYNLGESSEYYVKEIIDASTVEKLRDKIRELNEDEFKNQISLEYFENSSNNIQELLNGTTKPQEILFPQASTNTAFKVYHDNIFSTCMNKLAVKAVLKAVDIIEKENSEHPIKILEIGAGTGGTSNDILPYLNDKNVEYHFTDVSNFFLNKAREKYGKFPWIKYHIFDINQDYQKQGIEESSYDVILCANVLHVAINGDDAFATLKAISNSKGFLVIVDAIKELNSLLTSMGFLYRVDATDERREKEEIFFELEHWYKNFNNSGAEILYKYPSEDHFLACSYQRIFVGRFNSEMEVISNSDIMKYLKIKLPDYMIPVKNIILDHLPTTNNGKVDRKKLSDLIKAEKNYSIQLKGEETKNGLERQIESIWMSVLGIENRIGRDASFFEIGGDSLLLAQVIGKIKEEIDCAKDIQWDELMRIMLKNNTISLLCKALQGEKIDDNIGKLLREFSEGDKNEILVLFSDGTGTLSIYTPLIKTLKKNSYKKQIVGFNCGYHKEYLSIQREHLIKEIGKQCGQYLLSMNKRNYTLLGHCFGGALALEAARYLKNQGVNAKLILIDSKHRKQQIDNELILEDGFARILGADNKSTGYDMDDQEMVKNIIDDYQIEHNKFIGEEEFAKEIQKRTGSNSYVKLLEKTQEERINRIFESVSKNSDNHFLYEYIQFMSIYQVYKKSMESFIAYNPEPFDGDAIAFNCLEKNDFITAIPGQVSYIVDTAVKGKKEVHIIRGSHIGCMKEENIADIVNIL